MIHTTRPISYTMSHPPRRSNTVGSLPKSNIGSHTVLCKNKISLVPSQ